jgi:hypothetical protein
MSAHHTSRQSTEHRTGGCICGAIRYEICRDPLVVHACHCTYCQTESGAAFAVNLLVEADAVRLLRGMPQAVMTPSHSGNGQQIWRCPICQVAVWSNYAAFKGKVNFVRVGTLDHHGDVAPDIHIYTSSKQDWLPLPQDAQSVPLYYKLRDVWPESSVDRLKALRARNPPSWGP